MILGLEEGAITVVGIMFAMKEKHGTVAMFVIQEMDEICVTRGMEEICVTRGTCAIFADEMLEDGIGMYVT